MLIFLRGSITSPDKKEHAHVSSNELEVHFPSPDASDKIRPAGERAHTYGVRAFFPQPIPRADGAHVGLFHAYKCPWTHVAWIREMFAGHHVACAPEAGCVCAHLAVTSYG